MNTIPNTLRTMIVGLALVMMSVATAPALPLALPEVPLAGPLVRVSGDCYSMGMQEAARRGGQLARAEPEMRGGQQVCVIVVLTPGKDGQRPRRDEIVLPMG
jgi:hypothetical protein